MLLFSSISSAPQGFVHLSLHWFKRICPGLSFHRSLSIGFMKAKDSKGMKIPVIPEYATVSLTTLVVASCPLNIFWAG
jgi:hypothetical protein